MNSTIREIERGLDQDRMALAGALVELRDRLRPTALLSEGRAALAERARPVAAPLIAGVDGAVRNHPVIAAVAGVALATLVFGRPRAAPDSEAAQAVPAMAGTRFEALTRWEDEGGPPAPEPVDPDEDWLTEARGLRDRARAFLSQIDDAARRGLAPAAQLAKHRAEVIAALARDTRTALGAGLESLSGTARNEALLARERIYLGRIAVAEKGSATVSEHPLLSAAVLAAAGAALACLFPQTRTEDDLLGDASDRLRGEVKAMARSEALKASDFASTLTSALKSDMRRAADMVRPEPSEPVVRPVRG